MEQPSTRKQQHCFERLPPRKHLRFAANLLLGCVFFFFFFDTFGNFPGAPLTQLLQSRPLAYGTLPAFRGRDVPSDTFPRVTHTFPTDPGAVGPAAGGRAKTNGEIPPDPAREGAELWGWGLGALRAAGGRPGLGTA